MSQTPDANDRSPPAQAQDAGAITQRDDNPTLSASDQVTRGSAFAGEIFRFGNSHSFSGSIGPYRLVREIGRGGYGIVYVADDTRLGRQVAIKVARPEMVADAEGVARFKREAATAATLDHPGIIAVFDCGEIEGIHFYVMPYLDCPNLAQWLAQLTAPLSEEVVARLIIDLAEAIDFGHERGIIHRDVKPQNILLKPAPNHPNGFRPVVLDFGLCGLVDHSNDSTSMLAGTPRYMAPEQAMFGMASVDQRSDIYSIGVIMYQLLVGQPPHAAQSIAEAVLMLHGQPITPPRKHRPELSSDIETICMKCLRKDQERRYESAQQLMKDLEGVLNGAPIVARRESLVDKLVYSLRYGAGESFLGTVIITLNVTIFSWSLMSSIIVGRDFYELSSVTQEFGELLLFLFLVALPTHLVGIYLGWLMLQRTQRYRQLLAGLLFSVIWTVPQWQSVFSGRTFLSFYEGRELTQSVVFLLIAGGFTVQAGCLAIGAWIARWRARLPGKVRPL